MLCSMNHLQGSLRNLGKTFGVQEQLLNEELDHEEKFENTWKNLRNGWVLHFRNDVLSLAFIYAR